jgi:response regulator RpfG family c-di-GMP phosphodiesterase
VDVNREPLLLLIDDHRDTLVATGRLLGTCGFRVEIARGGEDGLAKAIRLHPDVIVTDLVMPTTSGYDVCERLHENEATRCIPLVIYTGVSDSTALTGLLQLGVRLFAIKPCVPTVVAREAHALLENPHRTELRVVSGYGEVLTALAEQVQAECR